MDYVSRNLFARNRKTGQNWIRRHCKDEAEIGMATNATNFGPPPTPLSSVHDPTKEGLKRRLERIASLVGSVNALAKTSRIPQSTIRKYFIRGDAPSTALIAIAEAAAVRPEWLLTGAEPMGADPVRSKEEKAAIDDVAFLPLYGSRIKSLNGRNLDEFSDALDYLPFKRSWLRRHVDVPPELLALLYVESEGMEPTIRRDDMVIIDLAETQVREGIYALIQGQELTVKRLQPSRSNQIKVISENKFYKTIEFPASEVGSQIKIMGRVAWVSRNVP